MYKSNLRCLENLGTRERRCRVQYNSIAKLNLTWKHNFILTWMWYCVIFFWKCDFHWKCTSNRWMQGAYLDCTLQGLDFTSSQHLTYLAKGFREIHCSIQIKQLILILTVMLNHKSLIINSHIVFSVQVPDWAVNRKWNRSQEASTTFNKIVRTSSLTGFWIINIWSWK